MAEVKLEGSGSKLLQVKDKPDLCLKLGLEEFPLHTVSLKTEEESEEDTDDSEDYSHPQPLKKSSTFLPTNHKPSSSLDERPYGSSDERPYGCSNKRPSSSSDERPYGCSNKRPSSSSKKRTSSSSEKRPHSCSHCGDRFRWSYQLHSHLLSHTGARSQCSICDRSYRDRRRFIQHMRTHTAQT